MPDVSLQPNFQGGRRQALIFKMKDALISVIKLFRRSVKAKSCESRTKLASSGGTNLHELCRQFSLEEIKAATNNFHKDLKIGRGGFGYVYKGFIDNGSMTVAIKRFSTLYLEGIDEFKNEVLFLCQLRHQNLISLIGFCNEGDEMILVCEYMNNLSLYDHVHGYLGAGCDPLSWEQRLKICVAVARALRYLHAGVKYAIIHRDVKSSGILLDENWTVKICDFGLSKLGPRSTSKSLIRVNSRVMGRGGYADPEYIATGELTEKSDIYSLGAVLLEVLCAKNVLDLCRNEDQRFLTEWARKCIENGSIYSIIDPYLEGRIVPESFKKFVEIAYDCTCEDVRDRPSMGEVEVTLELALELQEKALLHSCS